MLIRMILMLATTLNDKSIKNGVGGIVNDYEFDKGKMFGKF